MPSTRRSTRSSPVIDSKLRAVTPEEAESWSDGESDATLYEPELYDLDEARSYSFQPGDCVWVKTNEGNWLPGKVNGQTTRKGMTREREGLFYPVILTKGRVRKYYAPLNGEIKPDTPEIRILLIEGGWLDESKEC